MHEPIWKTDTGLFRKMVAPYALGIGSTLVAAIGAIGIIELAYFMSTRSTVETITHLYWLEIDAAGILPWIICLAVLAAGVAACRRTYPPMAASYNGAIGEAKAMVATQAAAAAKAAAPA